jgi:hypothetical protein
MSKRFYKFGKDDFQDWLDQRVWISGTQRIPRRQYIPVFAEELTSLCKKKGYVLDGRWGKGHKAVAKWMYALHIQVVARRNRYGPVTYPEIEHRDWPEDKDMFEINFDYEVLEEFFDSWRGNEDLDLQTDIGFRIFAELPTLLWHYVDLDESYQGRKMAKILESDSESEDDMIGVGDHLTDLTNGLHGTTKKILGVNTL